MDPIKEIIFNKHNIYRVNYKVPTLKYDEFLTSFSEARAFKIAENSKLEHEVSPYGENLFCCSNFEDIVKCVDSWMSEAIVYKETENNWNQGAGHFSQVIWEDSKKIGIGMAIMKNGMFVVVCNYDPPGNIIGNRPYTI